MSTPSTRRLAAVLIADVAGYSRMMERDEPGTHARLAAVRSEVTDPAVLRHGGRIVRTVGDGFLVEFPSAMSALEAAIEIQREMALRNRDVPAPKRIDHRIGINLGDIIVDERDIAGTGVNVAARIEALATPGGIAISGTVRDQVRQDLGIRLVDAGRHQVKNISRPIRVFRVELEGGVAAPQRRWRGRPMWWAAAAAVLLALAAALLAFWPQSQDLPPQSLIVLPFDHPPQSPRTAALAEALTRQVTVAAAQLPGATVIAPAVAAQYAARRGDIRSIGRELKVRYALDGRIEDAGSDLRLVAQVVDTATASSLWSGTLQAPQNADGTVPPALVGELSDSLRSVLRSLELKRLASGRDAASAYAVALAAVEALERSTDGDQLPAIRARFERALALDPQHVPALSGYAHTLVYLADAGASDAEALRQRADEASARAVTLQPDSAEAWNARANVLYFQGRYDAAAEALRHGLRLNPYLVTLQALDGQLKLVQDRGEESLAAVERAIALNPVGPAQGVLMQQRGRAQLLLGRYEEAIRSAERAITFGAEWSDYMLLAAAYALNGNGDGAARARRELLKLRPEFTIGWHRELVGSRAQSRYVQTLHDGLARAGVPK